MDPIAHTFFGATLAETGLKQKTRYGTATLIAGANLPDIDAIFTVLGRDTSLLLRRGYTHGILALVVLPLLLALFIRFLNRRKPPGDDEPTFDFRWVVALAYLGTWSHPLLDLMNTYGVRLLMPFDGRWFYGDTLFIIDPWFWLLTASAFVLAYSHSRRSKSIWLVLVTLSSLLVGFSPLPIPIGAKLLWAAGVLTIVWLRKFHADRAAGVARVGLATLVIYVGVVFVLARLAESEMREELPDAVEIQSNPVPAVPFRQRLVAQTADGYYVRDWDGSRRVIPRGDVAHPKVQQALIEREIRGFVNWMRFPQYEIEETDQGTLVRINDIRYVEPGGETRGIGRVEVIVD